MTTEELVKLEGPHNYIQWLRSIIPAVIEKGYRGLTFGEEDFPGEPAIETYLGNIKPEPSVERQVALFEYKLDTGSYEKAFLTSTVDSSI